MHFTIFKGFLSFHSDSPSLPCFLLLIVVLLDTLVSELAIVCNGWVCHRAIVFTPSHMVASMVVIVRCKLIYPGYITFYTCCNCHTDKGCSDSRKLCKCCQTLTWGIQLQHVWNGSKYQMLSISECLSNSGLVLRGTQTRNLLIFGQTKTSKPSFLGALQKDSYLPKVLI